MKVKFVLLSFGLFFFSSLRSQSIDDTLVACKKALQLHLIGSKKVTSIYQNDTTKIYYVTGLNGFEGEFLFGERKIKSINETEIAAIFNVTERSTLFKVSFEKRDNSCYLVAISDFMIERQGEGLLQTYYHGVQYFFKKDKIGKYNFVRSIDVTL